MRLTPEEAMEAIEKYAADRFGIIGTPTVEIVANNDIEEGSVIILDDIYEVIITTSK